LAGLALLSRTSYAVLALNEITGVEQKISFVSVFQIFEGTTEERD
jgi:hypothetical protein